MSKNTISNDSGIKSISPWSMPSYDLINLMNQYCIYNMIINGKRSNKSNSNIIDIMEKDSWDRVNWDIYNLSISKNIDLIFNDYFIDKINMFKNKVSNYR